MPLYKKCYLNHIPSELHRKGRKLFKKFFLHEEIYRRCKPEHSSVPFASISLYDISVNRQGKPSKPLCKPDDVLYNIIDKTGPDIPIHTNLDVVILVIKKLLKNRTYRKVFRRNGDTIMMYLKHDPVACNYSHSVFEVVLNGMVVTKANYNDTLKKNQYKDLRNDCRLELHKMMLRKEIRVK